MAVTLYDIYLISCWGDLVINEHWHSKKGKANFGIPFGTAPFLFSACGIRGVSLGTCACPSQNTFAVACRRLLGGKMQQIFSFPAGKGKNQTILWNADRAEHLILGMMDKAIPMQA